MMKKKASALKKTRKALFLFLVLLAIYISAIVIPYIPHKKVSENFKKQFQPDSCYGDSPGSERIAYITDNMDALIFRLKLIESAQEEIILSTFDFNADKSGKDIMAALLQAADRGVHIRVVVDGISGFLDIQGDPFFQAFVSHENIQLKIYNPVNLLKPWKLQARLHDKYLLIDDSMYMLGGRNTTNLFLGEYSSHQNIDKELFVYETADASGTSLAQLREYFETIWALPDSKDFLCKKDIQKIQDCRDILEKRYATLRSDYPTAWEEWDWNSCTMSANKITLLSNPIEAENKEPHVWYCITQLLHTGQDALIYTPYIICGKEMYQDLTSARQSLSSLNILTNDVSSGANPWGCTDYLNQKKRIWDTNVRVYEYLGPHSNHTKAILIDDRMSIIGSFNMDMRSAYLDTELMLAVDSPELNQVMQKMAVTDKTYSRYMDTASGTYQYGENYVPKEMSFGKKVFYALLRIITLPLRRFL
ncbi:phospholipase D-like domain-containing protein [Mediterraneibacter massiliensis]|uniref:phospholipase D-like domain-containing protein n=1 Tax=Mediterraneibacter massiliensis TaxID=1720300 RepID=UPI0024AE67AE|nr:phospholipase D-like domain-containing protein [Mediterraneibacter massiliensis]